MHRDRILIFILSVIIIVLFVEVDTSNGGVASPLTSNYAKERRRKEKEAARRARKIEKWGVDVDTFLERYGYLKPIPENAIQQRHDKYERKEAIRLFQEYNRIKQTGKLNRRTIKYMKEPRCSLPDVRLNEPQSRIRGFHQYHYYPRWRRSVLTWKPSFYSKKASPLGQWKTFRQAFEKWSQVSGITFAYTRENPDIDIRFVQGNHGDGSSNSFDEKGGQVAHAFGPGVYTISGDVHLDEDESWTLGEEKDPEGTNLLAVSIHEFGHALGLQHSEEPESVMHPSFAELKMELHITDMEAIQRLYGINPEMKAEPYRVEQPTTTPAPKVCKVSMEDIERAPDGHAYIFKKTHIRRIEPNGKLGKQKLNLWDMYEGGPKRADAVAYLPEKRRTYMFTNDTVWKFIDFKVVRGYPKRIVGRTMPETPLTALFVRDKYGITRLFLFGVTVFWEWSTVWDMVAKGYPLKIEEYWQGLPLSPTAAVRWTDGYLYFIKADKYYKVHPGSSKVLKDYPKPMPPDWMKKACK